MVNIKKIKFLFAFTAIFLALCLKLKIAQDYYFKRANGYCKDIKNNKLGFVFTIYGKQSNNFQYEFLNCLISDISTFEIQSAGANLTLFFNSSKGVLSLNYSTYFNKKDNLLSIQHKFGLQYNR